jgi:hypothetical protein
MNKYLILIIAALFLFSASVAVARDSRQQFSIADVMELPENASRLQGVAFYFGEQGHPAVKQTFGSYPTNKKTNAFNKSDLMACQRAMMSALLSLHQRALSLGANAVIDVISNYKNNKSSSETEFTCGAGNTVAGVALIGTVVTLE